jgi:hypothetical protein
METEDTLLQQPWVLAACGDLLLVQMFVRDAAATATDLSYNQNLFVYKTNPACPWLRRLPNHNTFPGFAQAFGLVPTDEGFVVASLLTFKTPGFTQETGEVAELLRYSSATERWDLISPTMPYDGDALRPHLWETDKVFSSPDGTIYWVDYYRGLLASQVTTTERLSTSSKVADTLRHTELLVSAKTFSSLLTSTMAFLEGRDLVSQSRFGL